MTTKVGGRGGLTENLYTERHKIMVSNFLWLLHDTSSNKTIRKQLWPMPATGLGGL
jgi:hypothetical protein